MTREAMTDQAAAPTPVKLRSSCDACGAAKLKCDRSQPRCGRCVSLDMTCVYGVSRQMGKPRKCSRQPQIPEAPRRRPEPGAAPSQYDDDSPGLVPDDVGRSEGGASGHASASAIGTHRLAHHSTHHQHYQHHQHQHHQHQHHQHRQQHHHDPIGLSSSWLASAANVTLNGQAADGFQRSSNDMGGGDGIWTDLVGPSPATDLADYANEVLHSEHENVWPGLQVAMATPETNLQPTAARQADDGTRSLADGHGCQELMQRLRQQHPNLAQLDTNALAGSNRGAGRAGNISISSSSSGVNGHDCFQDTYDILGSLFLSRTGSMDVPLSSISQSPMGPASRPAPIGTSSGSPTNTAVTSSGSGSGSSSSSNGSRVSLDEILHRSRQACARLSRVFTCPVCPRSANLALLHVSIISRILAWYQHAVDCMSSPTQLHALRSAMPPDSTAGGAAAAAHTRLQPHHAPLHMASPPAGVPFETQGGGASGSPWPGTPMTSGSSVRTSTTASTDNTSASSLSSVPDVTPMKIVMGTLDVRDQRVQMALNVQLLLGEVRGLAELMDQFCRYGAGGGGGGGVGSAGAGAGAAAGVMGGRGDNDLYYTLDTWLKAQHGRIVEMIRMHLRELNG